ncbi:MAG: leucyl aminopeptidase [bacterium]
MEIRVKNASLAEIDCDVVIVNLFKGIKLPSGATGAVDEALGGLISEFVINKDKFEGKFGDTYILQTYGKIKASKVLLVGLGEQKEFDLTKLRELSAKIIKKCEKIVKAKKICSILHGAGIGGLDPKECAKVITEGTLLGGYKFEKYKTKKSDSAEEFVIVEINNEIIPQIEAGVKEGKIVANATNFARDLINEPAMVVNPAKLAEIALNIKGIDATVLEGKDALKMGMGAFYAVGIGSENDSKFIHMKYIPKNPRKKVAIIGKGVTFDSGGLDIKPASSMREMKGDMSGAACVLGVMNYAKEMNLDIEIHAIIAAVENMPSGSSYRPGDILTALNGKTIEVDNTDAEGRLTLADALCYACDLKVDEIIDIATLTGACCVALGQEAAAIIGNNQDLIEKMTASAAQAGERFWQMPLYEEHTTAIKSDVADMKNTGGRLAGTMTAAAFLKEFVTDIPWIHLDIAGCAISDKEIRGLAKGPTGAGVRAFIYYLNSL